MTGHGLTMRFHMEAYYLIGEATIDLLILNKKMRTC
jgi:hypothetical protein